MPLFLAFIFAMRSKTFLSSELETIGSSFISFNTASRLDLSSRNANVSGSRTGFAKRKKQKQLFSNMPTSLKSKYKGTQFVIK